jgi:hypothetical protein
VSRDEGPALESPAEHSECLKVGLKHFQTKQVANRKCSSSLINARKSGAANARIFALRSIASQSTRALRNDAILQDL